MHKDFELIPVTMTRAQWSALVKKLRGYKHIAQGEGLQLGRFSWMAVAHIEARLAGCPERDPGVVSRELQELFECDIASPGALDCETTMPLFTLPEFSGD
jgi:hypothetical protein